MIFFQNRPWKTHVLLANTEHTTKHDKHADMGMFKSFFTTADRDDCKNFAGELLWLTFCSLQQRRNVQTKMFFFQSILRHDSCLSRLLPPPRDKEYSPGYVMHEDCRPLLVSCRTKSKVQSFINNALSKYQ